MDKVVKENLIHQPECFSRNELERRRIEHKFAHLSKVEAFAWDLELYGQLQRRFDGHIILKGGAAAQLLFPVSFQRNSVDIDVLTDLTPNEFEKGLDEIAKNLCKDGSVCTFQRYTPVNPTEGLKLTTYLVSVPTVCTKQEIFGVQDNTVQRLKLDVLYAVLPDGMSLSSTTPTFALELAFSPRVFTPDTLYGDKLLTLGVTTVGIPEARAADRCKQIYDLHNLIRLNLLSDSSRIQRSFDLIMDEQHHIAGRENISLTDAVIDVRKFLDSARQIDFNDPLGLWKALQGFQSNFVGVDARLPRETWAIGIEASRFLVQSLHAQRNGSIKDPVKLLSQARQIEEALRDSSPKSLEKREKLNKFLQDGKQKSVSVRGKSPARVFWYLVDPDNLDQISIALEM